MAFSFLLSSARLSPFHIFADEYAVDLSIIVTGHIGLPQGACVAGTDDKWIDSPNEGIIPMCEPGLGELGKNERPKQSICVHDITRNRRPQE
jgi:hypothetical protein